MAKTEKELRSMIWDNIPTETLLRIWERRLTVAILPDEIEKCKYKVNHYKGIDENNYKIVKE